MEKNHMQIPRGKAGKTLIAEVFITFIARLIKAVCVKTGGSHVSLHGHKSGTKSARELFKCSKDLASLVVCNERKFLFWVSDFL